MHPVDKKRGFSARLTAIAHGCVIPETELEVEVFEKTIMLHPEDPIPEALKDPFACFTFRVDPSSKEST